MSRRGPGDQDRRAGRRPVAGSGDKADTRERVGGEHGAVAAVLAHRGARQLTGEEAAQPLFEAGAVERRGVVLEDAGEASSLGDDAYDVPVPDVDEHGVAAASPCGAPAHAGPAVARLLGQRPVEGRRPRVRGEDGGAAPELGGEVGGGAQAGERRRDGRALVEEVGQPAALRDRLLPEAEAKDAV